MARSAKKLSFPPLHIKTVTSGASPEAGVCIIAGIWIRDALSRTFACEYGQCRHPLPQHLPRARWFTLVMTRYPVLGSV